MGDRTNPGFRLENPNASDESRLSALERSHMEMAVQLGRHEISMTYLSNDIKRGFDDLTTIIKPLSEKVTKLDDMLDSHDSFIVQQKEIIRDAKKDEDQAKKDKKGFRNKLLLAFGTAIVGAAGTMVWEHYLSHFILH